MNVLMIEPMKPPREVQIAPGLEPLQEAVGGDIQELCPFIDPVAIIANDEGKIMGLPANRALRDRHACFPEFGRDLGSTVILFGSVIDIPDLLLQSLLSPLGG